MKASRRRLPEVLLPFGDLADQDFAALLKATTDGVVA